MASEPTISGVTAVIGIGESGYDKRGRSPSSELRLAVEAIRAAADDAGIDVGAIDGFASYSGNSVTPLRLAPILGTREITYSNMVWEGGGGGCAAAVANAAAAVAAGFARYAVAFRSLCQGEGGRFGQGRPIATVSGTGAFSLPYGIFTPAQWIALRVTRFMHDHGVGQEALRAVALASYHHAQTNPRAVMYGRLLTADDYDASRWIAEPFHLFDCCQESDGAAAVLVTTTDRARDGRHVPAVVLGAAQGSSPTYTFTSPSGPDYAGANFTALAPRLFGMAGVGPADVDVAQVYENFTGATLMSIVEHGFCRPDEVNEFFTVENLTSPAGGLPLNTSGGNLAEAYIHGMELVVEAVRQVRGTSTAQVPDAEVSFVAGGPATAPVSDLILGRAR